MALVFANLTVCNICNRIIKQDDEIIGFPPFISNAKDPFYFFNDAAFHKTCLLNHSLGKKAISFIDRLYFKTKPENRKCDIGGGEIPSFSDFIFVPMLTSDATESVYKYNFMTINKRNIPNWPGRQKMLEDLKEYNSSGNWENPLSSKHLEQLISKLIV